MAREIRTVSYKIGGRPVSLCSYEDATDSISLSLKRRDQAVFLEFADIAPFIPAGSSVLDIGAHIGLASIYYLSLGYRVFSFEAARENIELLKHARRINGFDNWTIVENAVSDKPGIVRFLANGPYGHMATDAHNEARTESIEAIALDDWLAAHTESQPIGLVKMDIEGAEVLALKGAQAFFSQPHAPALFVESNGHCLQWFDATPGTLQTALQALGYATLGIRSQRVLRPTTFYPVPANSLQARCCVNYYCVKSVPALKALGGRVESEPTGTPELLRNIAKTLKDGNTSERAYLSRVLPNFPEISELPAVRAILERKTVTL